MSWSLISLNLQYYNYSLLSYNHSQIIQSLLQEANSGVTLLGQSFSLYLKKHQDAIMLLYPSVFHIHTSSEQQFYKNYICGQTIVTLVAVLHANESKTVTVNVFPLRRNRNTDLLVLTKLKFLRILNSSVDPRISDDVLKL